MPWARGGRQSLMPQTGAADDIAEASKFPIDSRGHFEADFAGLLRFYLGNFDQDDLSFSARALAHMTCHVGSRPGGL